MAQEKRLISGAYLTEIPRKFAMKTPPVLSSAGDIAADTTLRLSRSMSENFRLISNSTEDIPLTVQVYSSVDQRSRPLIKPHNTYISKYKANNGSTKSLPILPSQTRDRHTPVEFTETAQVSRTATSSDLSSISDERASTRSLLSRQSSISSSS